ncbi:CAP domain-containing protein [Streptomyces griseoaurantiacus]|jgi:uncharacterized protein YkwD|uniref:CAP domain-containing protein n=1 Tax=Streptomyces griseoaurantiacus TaxID=68213 RepID=A0A7W2HVJ3_9ACTN|nr:CAP domain-containing protein [Streptomyces griseoaurantiacus]MBA5223211.1 CAP domain-containing protein [Streptomyces griseoaurantiacus]
MGRHRRSDAGRAATGPVGHAGRVSQAQQTPAEHYGPENLYGFAAVLEAEERATRSHRRKKAATPVRTGLLGVSAAVALGTAAVATGVLPGSGQFTIGGGSDNVQAGGTPTGFESQQGGAGSTVEDGPGATLPGGATDGSASPSAPEKSDRAGKAGKSSTKPSQKTKDPAKKKPASPSAGSEASTAPGTGSGTKVPPQRKATPQPEGNSSVATSAQATAEAQVLALVNEERANAGCRPVAANSALRDLAADFSEDMAARSFFDHTDPSGNDPWDRAEAAGVSGLGGENIARGQATAQAVMDSWMNSPGHRANILNCDFKTLGVGVHFAEGGPWWTQDFGY